MKDTASWSLTGYSVTDLDPEEMSHSKNRVILPGSRNSSESGPFVNQEQPHEGGHDGENTK